MLETNELIEQGTREKLNAALERINRAIKIAPDDVMLFLTRASIFYLQRRYPQCRSDCDFVLSNHPNTWLAYFWRGVANVNVDPKQADEDLRKALDLDPANGNIMEFLAKVLFDHAKKDGFASSGRQLDEALQLLTHSVSSNVNFRELPYIYRKIASVHCARGNFEEAIKSLDTAITIISNSSKALNFCWQGLETLTADEKQMHHAEVKQEIAATMATISQILERAGSRDNARAFWQSIVDLDSMELLRGDAKAELGRLAKAR